MSDTRVNWVQEDNLESEDKPHVISKHPIDVCIQKGKSDGSSGLRQGVIFNHDLSHANIIIPSYMGGYPGVAHGGIVAMLMDEVMGYAFRGKCLKHALTIRLSVTYIEPVPLNELLIIEAKVAKAGAGETRQVVAEILDQNRRCFASGTGVFTAIQNPYKYAS